MADVASPSLSIATDAPHLSLVAGLIAAEIRASFGRCRYCGQPTVGTVCRAHTDLPALERAFYTGPSELLAA